MAAAVGVMPSKDNSDGSGGASGGDVATPRAKTASSAGTIKTEVGHSQFFSKLGILPIYESTSNSSLQRTATVRFKQMTRKPDLSSRFPRIEDCAHFHYDLIEMGNIDAKLCERIEDGEEPSFNVCVTCGSSSWYIRRTYENFRLLDKQLHKCIYDRKFSRLPRLRKEVAATSEEELKEVEQTLATYLKRFSTLTAVNNTVNCGPVLNWLEMDNRGNQLMVHEDSEINIPGVAAAHVVKRYQGQSYDELSLDVGDIISVIDMPPPEDTTWWRGKKDYKVGFFPSDCVEVICDTVPQAVISLHPCTQKPVLRKHGKVISFLRTFFSHRVARSTLKERGIVKERVFGCDLGEHLLNTGTDIPLVLETCINAIESQGIVDGIYRLSGVASNIQRLRFSFDENQVPAEMKEPQIKDIHSISSLLKMYFRELPNPLLTYQLYDKFAAAVHHGVSDDLETHVRLRKIHDVVQQLPPPHYRTCECLMRHLLKVGESGHETGMHPKNLAIVWAPNLLRSKELETGSGTAVLRGVGIQAIITEYLIRYADYIFSDKLLSSTGASKKVRPKSLAISTPGRLLSLEEAREREQSRQTYIEVGGGTAALPEKYHTIIDLPSKKGKKSPGGGWKSIFSKSKSPGKGKRKASLPMSKHESKSPPESEPVARRMHHAKSAESLLIMNNKRSSGVSITIPNPYAGDISPVIIDPSSEPRLTPVASAPSPLTRASSHESFFEENNFGPMNSPTTFYTDFAETDRGQRSTSKFYDSLDDNIASCSSSQSTDTSKFYIVTSEQTPPNALDRTDSNRSSIRAKIAKAISPKSPRKKMKTQSPASKRRAASKTQSDASAAKEAMSDSGRVEHGANGKQSIRYVAQDESSPGRLTPLELQESPGARRRVVRRFSDRDGSMSDDGEAFRGVATMEEEGSDVFEEEPVRRPRAHTVDTLGDFVVTPEDERLFPGMGADEQMLLTRQASNARVSRVMSFSNAEKPAIVVTNVPRSSPNLLLGDQTLARSSFSDDTDSISSISDLYTSNRECHSAPTFLDLLNMAADDSCSETASVHTLKAPCTDDSDDSDTASAQSSFTRYLPTDIHDDSHVNKQLAGLRASLMKELDMFSESADSLNEDDSPVSLQAEIVSPSFNTAHKSEQQVMMLAEAKPHVDHESRDVSDAFSVFCPSWNVEQPLDRDSKQSDFVEDCEKLTDEQEAKATMKNQNDSSISESVYVYPLETREPVATEVSGMFEQSNVNDLMSHIVHGRAIVTDDSNSNHLSDPMENSQTDLPEVNVDSESVGRKESSIQESCQQFVGASGVGGHSEVVLAAEGGVTTPFSVGGSLSDDEVTKDAKLIQSLGKTETLWEPGHDARDSDADDDNNDDDQDGGNSEQSETESASELDQPPEPQADVVQVTHAEFVVTPVPQVATPVHELSIEIDTSTEAPPTDAFACFSPHQEAAKPSTLDNPCHVEISVRRLSNDHHVAEVKSVHEDSKTVEPRPPTPRRVVQTPKVSEALVYPVKAATRPTCLPVTAKSAARLSPPLQDTFSSFAVQCKSPPVSQSRTTFVVTGRSSSQKEKEILNVPDRPKSSVEFGRSAKHRPRHADSYVPPQERCKDSRASVNSEESELLQSAFDLMKQPNVERRRKGPLSTGRKGSFKELRSKFETNEGTQSRQSQPPKLSQPWTAIL